MAKFLEYQGKECRERWMPVPKGEWHLPLKKRRKPPADRRPRSRRGRARLAGGKAGIVKLADTPEEARALAEEILAKTVKGLPVEKVLIEEKLDIRKEYYCSFVINNAREARCPMLMFSTEGGMDIESVDESLLFRLNIDPQYGLQSYDAIDVHQGIAPADLSKFASFLTKLSKLYKEYDCQTLEINPFVMTGDGSLYCADCKMEIDNSAVFRHPDFGIKIARDLPGQPTDLDVIGWGIEETDARGTGFLMNMGYDEVSPGYVGYHPIGGGSAMMGLDALNAVGLKAANYADTSGNPVAAKIYRVAKATLSQPNIEGYLLGGFMMANQEQWHHAHALVKVLREMLPKKPGFPCVLLLCGNREDESLEILRTGLADMMTPDGIGRRIEIYGREHVTDTKFIGERLLALCKEYSAEKTSQKAG
ncbi:MAG: ATP-grasp domain-containing protein [Bilophila wadsworthia]